MNRGRFAFLGPAFMSPTAADSLAYALAARPGSRSRVADLAARMQQRIAARRNAELRALLGRWVSACELSIAVDRSGQLLGLSDGGIIHIGMDLGEER